MSNLIKIEEICCGRTYLRTQVRTDIWDRLY